MWNVYDKLSIKSLTYQVQDDPKLLDDGREICGYEISTLLDFKHDR